jgi:hypothetical protein
MRDIKRIDKVLRQLGRCWRVQPDFRLGQLLQNAVHQNDARGVGIDSVMFNIEDSALVDAVLKFMPPPDGRGRGICGRCGGSTRGQSTFEGNHRYYPDCINELKLTIAALAAKS